MNLPEYFQKQVKKQVGYFPVWIPMSKMEVGDIVIKKDGFYQQYSKIKNFPEIELGNIIPEDTVQQSITLDNNGTVTTDFQVAGSVKEVLSKSSLGLTLNFDKGNSFYLNLTGITSESLEDSFSLGEQLIKYNQQPVSNWDKRFYVVTDLIYANSGLIVLNSGKKRNLHIKAKTEVTTTNIAEVNGWIDTKFTQNTNNIYVITKKSAVLFRARRLYSTLLGDPVFESMNQDFRNSIREESLNEFRSPYHWEMEQEDEFE